MKRFLKTWRNRTLLTAATILASQATLALTNLSATSDATNVSYSFSYSGAPTFLHMFLDTDRNSGTGYKVSGIGADYMIENGNLYKYSGSAGAWGWTFSRSSNMVQAAPNVRWTVARTSLGSPAGINLIANTSAGDSSAIVSQSLATTTTTTQPPTTTTLPPSTVSWTRCAVENGVCSFTGTRQVRYGANGVYAFRTATGSIGCDNATFGDPLSGVVKACDYSSSVQSTSTTTTMAPTPTTLPPSTTTTLPPPPPAGTTQSKSYGVSTANFVNPERGFFWMTDCRANPRSVAALQAYRAQNGHSVLHCMWYLREFTGSPLSATVLSQLQTQMDNVRTAGFKMILRFAYTDTSINDAPLSVVNQHLDQLAPYLQRNSDIISTVQVGLIGQWGEMSTSSNFGNPSNSTDWANRKALIDKLLSVVPSNRMVAVRTPAFKMNPYGTTALSATEAFTGTSKARVGHYNDCFISSSNDMGTYLNTAERDFVAADTKYVSMSGETCAVAAQNDCAPALAELAKNHWTHLHEGYNTSVYDKWKNPQNECFSTVQKKLGYRFELQNGSYSTGARVGGALSVAINLQNTGFAAPYNPRGLELILRNTSSGAVYRVNLSSDPRRWLPGSPIAINQTVTLPNSMPAGNYALLLNLPDPAASLYGRPDYSIQLANTGVWESSTGFNNLGMTVVVSP
jgi:hypothetical protein